MNILYSTGCVRCVELKAMLDAANIKYKVVSNVEEILSAGIDRVPVLQANRKRMDFKEAKEWILKQCEEKEDEKQ